jgi:hypothetical protein
MDFIFAEATCQHLPWIHPYFCQLTYHNVCGYKEWTTRTCDSMHQALQASGEAGSTAICLHLVCHRPKLCIPACTAITPCCIIGGQHLHIHCNQREHFVAGACLYRVQNRTFLVLPQQSCCLYLCVKPTQCFSSIHLPHLSRSLLVAAMSETKVHHTYTQEHMCVECTWPRDTWL